MSNYPELETDEVWLLSNAGKKRRILYQTEEPIQRILSPLCKQSYDS